MTRKHFQLLADNLKFNKPWSDKDSLQLRTAVRQWETDCVVVADACKSFNGRFDRDRFLAACGVDSFVWNRSVKAAPVR